MNALDPESPEMPRSEWTQAERDRDDLAEHLGKAQEVYDEILELDGEVRRLFLGCENPNDERQAVSLMLAVKECILAEVDRRKKALREFDEQH